MADTDLSAPVLPAGSQWKTGGYNVKPGENGMQDGDEVEEERMFVYKGHTDDRPLIWRQPLNDLVSTINEVCCLLMLQCPLPSISLRTICHCSDVCLGASSSNPGGGRSWEGHSARQQTWQNIPRRTMILMSETCSRSEGGSLATSARGAVGVAR